jgi:hypothetical protein
MADDVQDIYVSTDAGTEWQSLSALAAEQVDAKLPIESVDGTVKLDGAYSVFTVSTGGQERVVVDSIGNVTIKEKLKGDGNYTPLIELAAGSTVNVTASRYYNYYASDSSLTHREIIYNADSEAACSFLVYGKTYASGLPVGIPAGEQPSHFKSSHDLVHEVKRTLWCSSATNAEPDVVIDCTTDSNDPVLKVTPKGHIEASRIVGAAAPASDAEITLGGNFTVSTGGEERVNVSDSSITNRVNQVLQINKNATTAPNNAANVNNKQMMTLKSTDEVGAKFIGLSFQHVLSGGKGASACIGLQDESADGVPNKGEMQFVIRGDNSTQVKTPLKINKDAIIVEGQIQTPSVRGPADNDAEVTLGGHITVNAKTGSTAEELVAVFSSYASQPQRGLQIKNGINGNRANAHVFFNAKSDSNIGKMTFQTDGSEVFSIGRLASDKPLDIIAFDGYVPQTANSIATKKTVDDKIWVGTTAQYLAIPIRDILPTTLYCLTD